MVSEQLNQQEQDKTPEQALDTASQGLIDFAQSIFGLDDDPDSVWGSLWRQPQAPDFKLSDDPYDPFVYGYGATIDTGGSMPRFILADPVSKQIGGFKIEVSYGDGYSDETPGAPHLSISRISSDGSGRLVDKGFQRVGISGIESGKLRTDVTLVARTKERNPDPDVVRERAHSKEWALHYDSDDVDSDYNIDAVFGAEEEYATGDAADDSSEDPTNGVAIKDVRLQLMSLLNFSAS